MSGSKHFDRIAVLVTAITLVVTILFMNGTALGIEVMATAMGYENRLFDNTKVHTIDIVMSDWDDMIDNATSEEYYTANVIIDGESYKNVGIRTKGNTSLSTVATLGSERYSFKIEFDHYDSTKSYHGLDKLSLNNLIQDSTMMKDYLTYTMMNEFGVNSSLCSFVYITVNGEDWGLYLAVEGVEEAFLERNYGSDYGELYKPDSLSFGGGRGNGGDFDMNDFNFDFGEADGDLFDGSTFAPSTIPGTEMPNAPSADGTKMSNVPSADGTEMPNAPSGMDAEMPNVPSAGGTEMPNMPSADGTEMPNASFADGTEMSNVPFADGTEMPNMPSADGTEMPNAPSGMDAEMSNVPSAGGTEMPNAMSAKFGGNGENGGGFGGGMGMGSDDVKLQYIDDDLSSYSNIWNNAKTDITEADQTRLLESLKKLSANEDIASVVDVEQVIRYFVVHNYVCNGDSYTGSMVHNYYLYEKDGKMAMIPWDYNLAFGTFQGSNATGTVNTPIDSPVDNSSDEDRPMWNWILQNEEYTEAYHQYFSEFLSSVDIAGIIDNTYNLIKDYVAKDPTAFYGYEEFEQGVETIRQFCALRSESILLQLENNETTKDMNYVDASDITLSDMGSMGGGMGGGDMPGMPDNNGGGFMWGKPDNKGDFNGEMPDVVPDIDGAFERPENKSDSDAAMPDGFTGDRNVDVSSGDAEGSGENAGNLPDGGNMQMPGRDFSFDRNGNNAPASDMTAWLWLAVSVVILAIGLKVAKKYRT